MILPPEGVPAGDLPGAQATGVAPQGAAPAVFSGPRRRVVFDTNVLVSLYVFDDSRFLPLRRMMEDGHWRALTNPACLGEFRRVLAYPMFARDPAQQAAALAAYVAHAESVVGACAAGALVALPRCKDRDDQKFLELARDGTADCLITADKALLKLARRDRLRGLFRIITPDVALAETLA